ncbi:1-aminocyclopropane-1-carboxylate deaminase/D-cysteine desulfhydrase [Shewanella aestuarii]|uniref:1-aminocyclopropane-1-carboxylate deaminase/D-cysteine desulfhydrase n=1 Tax=Shewanella aestuarii TaxID=1028752 RepID=A0A6G9QKP3_9GAMM|nr:1-aminocyclopropane-1-carboxylate deaminase/D-cysteine desulfhydrase [Shewanella aestuarii]QIR14411.1 1-aminocyclopropane-1-carboxylate deaminase/D-cysteine desulfhydrase [Shewanella aestuarii]
MFTDSPTQEIFFAGHKMFVKRDDLLHPDFSGNKARKFFHFLKSNNNNHVKCVVGSGSAQANSLYSLSVLAKLKGWDLDYYVSHISDALTQQLLSVSPVNSNYVQAVKNGANVKAVNWSDKRFNQCQHLDDAVEQLKSDYYLHYGKQEVLFIPEGGRCEYAKTGVAILASEIINWAIEYDIDKLTVFLPSGTGTTALYLQQSINEKCDQHLDIKVMTCSTVGGDDYLVSQFRRLSSTISCFPEIVTDGNKYHFGKLYLNLFELWQEVLATTGITFDLLYDPIGLAVLKHQLQTRALLGREVLYIHQGGLLGNVTMLPRYLRKQKNKKLRKL